MSIRIQVLSVFTIGIGGGGGGVGGGACQQALLTKNLKDDMNNRYDWSVKWKMLFNPDFNKPAEKVFTNRNVTSYETVSYVSCVDVQPVESHTHLGFVLR